MRIASQSLLSSLNGEELLWLAIHSNVAVRGKIQQVLDQRTTGKILRLHRALQPSAPKKNPAYSLLCSN